MTYYRSNAKRGAVWAGPETSFGAGASELSYIKVKEFQTPTGLDYQPADDIVQEDAEDAGSVLYVGGELSLKGGLHPCLTAFPTAKPGENQYPPMAGNLSAVLGEPLAGGYGVTDTTGNSATELAFPSAGSTPTSMGFKCGELVWVKNAAGTNVLGVNAIKTVNDSTKKLTLRSPLPGIPGSQAVVYGGHSWAKLPIAAAPSYEIVTSGEAAFDHQHFLGCCIKALSLDAPHGGTATLSATYQVAQPVPPASGETGGAPTSQAYPWPGAPQVLFGGLWLHDHTGAGTSYKIEGGVSIEFGVDLQPVGGLHGTDPLGTAGFVITERKIRVKVTPAYTSNALFALFENPPTAGLTLSGWWGRGAASWGFNVPNATIVSAPKKTDKNGVAMLEIEFGCAAYSGDTDDGYGFAADEAGDKPFVIGVLSGTTPA